MNFFFLFFKIIRIQIIRFMPGEFFYFVTSLSISIKFILIEY